MAEIVWKGIIWRAAYGQLSVKELLTILKGFGAMETVEFEKPGCFRGELSLSLSPEGNKEVTLYHLEILGPRRRGHGRETLAFLKSIFRGAIHVEDAEMGDAQGIRTRSLVFWAKMLEEGLIDSLNTDLRTDGYADHADKNAAGSAAGAKNRNLSGHDRQR